MLCMWKAVFMMMLSKGQKYYDRKNNDKLKVLDENFPFVEFVSKQFRYQERRQSIFLTRYTLNPLLDTPQTFFSRAEYALTNPPLKCIIYYQICVILYFHVSTCFYKLTFSFDTHTFTCNLCSIKISVSIYCVQYADVKGYPDMSWIDFVQNQLIFGNELRSSVSQEHL